jgi:radical SAM superfamily enzyme YgiQ (UPF0313 family)
MNPYSEPVFRPPSEAFSLIVQLTEGCAYNRCRFCPMYKTKLFHCKSTSELAVHLDDLRTLFPDRFSRAFLADGDGLVVPTADLLAAMAAVRLRFPAVRRFGIYGSVFSLAGKTVADLRQLRAAGLRVLYLGLESGDEETLKRMDKFLPTGRIIDLCRSVGAAGINLSVTVIIGLGGRTRSRPHIRESVALVDAIGPSHTSLLNLMLVHTPLRHDPDYYAFDPDDYFRETAAFIAGLTCRTIFRANHTSNPVALEGVLPRDRDRLLAEIACGQS